MHKLIRALIAVSVVAALGIAVSVNAASAARVHRVAVKKVLKSPKIKRSPVEEFGTPAAAQFIRIPGTNRFHVRSLHGGLDD